MKKCFFAFLITLPFLAGCDYLVELRKFEIPFTQSITLPAMPASDLAVPLAISGIKTNIDSVLYALDLTANVITDVELKKMEFTLSSPENGDLSFLKSVDIFITSDGFDDIKIASSGDISESTINYVLTLANVDFKDIILKKEFGLRIETTTDKPTTEAQIINISYRFWANLSFEL